METPGDGLLVLFAKFPGFQSYIIGCWFLIVSTPEREGERAWWKKGGTGREEEHMLPTRSRIPFLLHVCDHLGDSKILNKCFFFRVFLLPFQFPSLRLRG